MTAQLSSEDHDNGFVIRQALPSDHEALCEICLTTGDAGEDATHLHKDPRLLGNFFAVPYQVLAPTYAFVLEGPEGVMGYAVGALDSVAFYDRMQKEWLKPLRRAVRDPGPFPLLWRKGDWLRRRIHVPAFEVYADLARYPSHGHINLRPQMQGRGFGAKLLGTLMARLAASGSAGLHLVVTPGNDAALKFCGRLGFKRLSGGSIPKRALILVRALP